MKLTKELVRLHARLCGDGCLGVYKTSEPDRINRTELYYFNNNQELLLSFKEDMQKCFGVKTSYIPKRNMVRLRSIRIGNIFLNLTPSFKSREWRIPEIIKRASDSLKVEWLTAFFHDEGYLPPDRNLIRVKSVNPLGLADAKEMLDSMNIRNRLTGPNCDSSYYLNIRKEGYFKDFHKLKMRGNTRKIIKI